MDQQIREYSWAEYYKDACDRQKKKNHMLAAKLAEAETKQEDLTYKWNRIRNNAFFKLTVPMRKLCHLFGNRRAKVNTDRCAPDNPCVLAYEQELQEQRFPYLKWIAENEGTEAGEFKTPPGLWRLEAEDSDLVLFGYGENMLSYYISDVVKAWFNNNKSYRMAYCDEDFYWETTQNRMCPWYKPCYSPNTLLSFNYFGRMVIVRKEICEKMEVLQDNRAAMERFSFSYEQNSPDKGDGTLYEDDCVTDDMYFYDLCLRLEEVCLNEWRAEEEAKGNKPDKAAPEMRKRIGHIEKVLLHKPYVVSDANLPEGCTTWDYFSVQKVLMKELEESRHLIGVDASFCEIKLNALKRRGMRGSMAGGNEPGIYHIAFDTTISGRERCMRAQNHLRATESSLYVSVVIPSKDHPDVLKKCLESFVEKTDYPYYEFIIVDNGSTQENKDKLAKEILPAVKKRFMELHPLDKLNCTYIYTQMLFNFSKMCNIGVKRAQGDFVLLLNDDIEIIEASWLSRMVGQALVEGTGAVGAKLWYADSEKIQHAGITNLAIGPSHKLITFEDNKDYYYGHNRVTYDMIGVTAACMLVRQDLYEEVGGFDEELQVAYNDVDFCFKLHEAGYVNVLRNDAILHHHESLSRGTDEGNRSKWGRLLNEKALLFDKHPKLKNKDPYYHSLLIDDASDYGCNFKYAYNSYLHTVSAKRMSADYEKKVLRKAGENVLQLTVDRLQMQNKIHRGEPDILWIMGWCYVPGADNAAFEKTIVLQGSNGNVYTAKPANWNRKDVEDILTMECNIGLAGFVLRVNKRELEPGEYRIAMLCTDLRHGKSGCKYIKWHDETIIIQETGR